MTLFFEFYTKVLTRCTTVTCLFIELTQTRGSITKASRVICILVGCFAAAERLKKRILFEYFFCSSLTLAFVADIE